MVYLNLGCGTRPVKDALNVDIMPGEYVDKVVDLRTFPWPWTDESVDGIYMMHSIEHFEDIFKVIKECYRILKTGGFFYIQAPHASNCSSLGNLGHYKVFGVRTMRDFVCNNYYIFGKPLFKEEIARISWLHLPYNNKHPYLKFKKEYPEENYCFMHKVARVFAYSIQKLIDKDPDTFERGWCYWVGGAHEIIWKGIKV